MLPHRADSSAAPTTVRIPPCLACSTASVTPPAATPGGSSRVAADRRRRGRSQRRRRRHPNELPATRRRVPTGRRRARGALPRPERLQLAGRLPRDGRASRPETHAALSDAGDSARRRSRTSSTSPTPSTRADRPSARTARRVRHGRLRHRRDRRPRSSTRPRPRSRRCATPASRWSTAALLGYRRGDEEPGSEMIGMAVAVVVLAIAFGSLVAMSLPIGVALIGLLVGTSAIGILSGYVPSRRSPPWSGSMLGLGVGIDYALFILARHRQNIDRRHAGRRVRRPRQRHGRAVGALRRQHRGRGDRRPAGGRHPDARRRWAGRPR